MSAKRFRGLILSLFFMIFTASAHALVIGTSPDDPPLSSYANKNQSFYGFEIDIMMEICMRMHVKCQFVPTIASEITRNLSSGKIDLAVAAVIIPPAGLESEFIFSLPYLTSQAQFITQKSSTINNLEDIRNKRVGVRLGTLFKGNLFNDFVLNKYNHQVKTSLYLSMSDLLAALEQNKVDVAFSNAVPIRYWYTNNSDIFKLVGEPISIGNGYGVIGRIGQEEIMTQINKALLQMETDGTYVKIYNQYFNL